MSPLPAVTFTGGTVDRAAHLRGRTGLIERLLDDASTRVIDLAGDGFGVDADGHLVLRPPRPSDARADLVVFLGEEAPPNARPPARAGDPDAPARPAYVLVVGATDDGDGRSLGLRELAGGLDPDVAGLVATSLALANWHRTHPRCSRCGGPTEPALAGWIRRCAQDGSEHYPRTDIAVIMAVTDPDDRLLLGRAPSWPEGRMSILAGFVEPGETLAQAVTREVREEVGVEVHAVTYVADQPWPFPTSLMVGFTARADRTGLVLDTSEIAEARWVSRADVAALVASGEYRPSPGFSISRALVEDWYGGPLPTGPGGP